MSQPRVGSRPQPWFDKPVLSNVEGPYLAQDTLLDREVAFALIKTEGLDCMACILQAVLGI